MLCTNEREKESNPIGKNLGDKMHKKTGKSLEQPDKFYEKNNEKSS